MDTKSCKILEKVLMKFPPDIPWKDLIYLLKQVADHFKGEFKPTPGGRIRLTLSYVPSDPTLPKQEDTLNIPYSNTVFEAKTKEVAGFLMRVGVKSCSS